MFEWFAQIISLAIAYMVEKSLLIRLNLIVYVQ